MRHQQMPYHGAQPLGVRGDPSLDEGRDDDHRIPDAGGVPPSLPTTPPMKQPAVWAVSSALTMFPEMPRSRSPPPTEKTRRPSFAPRRDPSSQLLKEVSQPSSLIRAVNSDTLSTGVYASKPQSLRKSLTAWLACPAEPPTPRMKSRPERSRTLASPSTSRSTASPSMAATICRVSSRYASVNVVMTLPLRLPCGKRRMCSDRTCGGRTGCHAG